MKHDLILFRPDGEQVFMSSTGRSKQRARGREEDLLVAFLSLRKPSDDAASIAKELEKHTTAFYKTSGSVTKAIKVFVEGINRFFLQKNNYFDQPESWQTATLMLAVVHHGTLFLAQVGATQSLVFVNGQVERYFDESLDQRGLGVATVTTPRYYQLTLRGNETIVFTNPDENGESDFTDLTPVVGELKLRSEENQPLSILQVKPGAGETVLRHLDEFDFAALLPALVSPEPEVTEDTLEPEPIGEAEQAAEPQEPCLAEDLFGQAVLYNESEPEEGTKELTVGLVEEQTQTIEVAIALPDEPQEQYVAEGQEENSFEKPDFGVLKAKTLKGVAAGAGWLRRVEDKAGSIASTGNPSVAIRELPVLTKILIAVLVPVVIVILTAMVFFNRGENHEYAYFLAQAEASVNNAGLMQTADLQREGWEQALLWLDQAAAYQDTTEVQALRLRAQTALDDLEGARRLHYVAAFAPALYPDLDIGSIVSLGSDLYLLDRALGSVKYLRLHSNGYVMESDFTCGPGTYGGIQVGELVDLISIPLNNPAKAPVLAIDSGGNLLYCSPNTSPSSVHLLLPDNGWANLSKIVFDSNRLYVLDSGNAALWIYRGFTANFTNAPVAYFDEEMVDLSSAIDFAVEGEELFVLHKDGLSSHCLTSFVTGITSCEVPYPYHDAGTSGTNVDFATLKLEQIAYSPPPDPSIYYLEPERAELYQFSLKLNLNRVLRSGVSSGVLPQSKVSAFYVSPDRRIFMAFGGQLYYAVLP